MELEKPNLISPIQGLTFLAGLAAERERQEEYRNRAVAALQKSELQSMIQNERLNTMSSHYDDLAQRYQWEHQDRESKLQAAFNKGKAVQTGVTNFQKDVAGIDAKKGTLDWDQKFNLILDKPEYYDIKSTPEFGRVASRIKNESDTIAKGNLQSKQRIISDFDSTLKNHGLNENAINYDLDKYWRKQPDDTYVLPFDSTGNVPEKNVDTSKLDPYGQPFRFSRRVPLSQIGNWREQQKKINDMRAGGDIPSPSAFTPVQQPALPFPADKSQAIVGQTYSTPKGDLIWTGTGFRTP